MLEYANQEHTRAADGIVMVDTHCHLDCEPLSSRLPHLLPSARRAGVAAFVVPGVHPANWGRIAALAREHEGVGAAFGIHPMHAELADDATLADLEALAGSGVAIGEIGLDPVYPIQLERQERAFRDQLRLAATLGLPVLIHCRRLFERTRVILKEERAERIGGIMHAFSGSPEMAREFIRLGFMISLSGVVTWREAARPARLAREIPLKSMVLETDAPDLTPQRFRGQPNQPAWLRETLATVAGIRGMEAADLAAIVLVNSRRALGRLFTR